MRRSRVLALVAATVVSAGCSAGSAPGSFGSSSSNPSVTATAKSLAPSISRSDTSPIVSCPTNVPPHVPSHQRDGTGNELVPGQPTELLACRYHGFNQAQPIGTFATSAELSASDVATELNRTPRPAPGASIPNCPADFGEKYMLWFRYADGVPLLVSFDHGGCLYVDNGDLRAPFPPVAVTQRLQSALASDDR